MNRFSENTEAALRDRTTYWAAAYGTLCGMIEAAAECGYLPQPFKSYALDTIAELEKRKP